MRLERWAGVVVLSLALGACATTSGGSGSAPASNFNPPPNVNRQDAARIHTALARHYMTQGLLKQALEKLQLALKFDQSYTPAHTLLAVLYERIGETQQAEAQYRQAVKEKPKDGDTNNNLGVFLCKHGKPQESLAYFDKAVADPFYKTPAAAYANAGICAMKIPDEATAMADLRKALGIDPHNPDALYWMAKLLYKKNDPFRASAYLQRFDALKHPSAQSLALGYRIETRLGDAEGARTYLHQLRARFPDSEQAQSLDVSTDSQ